MEANLHGTGARALQWTAEAYLQARELRAAAEAQLPVSATGEPDRIGAQSAEGSDPGAVLARVYLRNREQEREMGRILEEMLQEHPAWRWLSGIPGVGLGEAGRLLARLDVRRAPTPSAFWAYCGLATVPGVRHRCAVCGLERTVAESTFTPATHLARGGTQPCSGRLLPLALAAGVRVAQPRPSAGERAAYDREAKKICYEIAHALRGAEHRYEAYYLEQRAELDRTRPAWAPARRHMTALRKMEKLFLAHLWLVWREEVGLPLTEPAPASRDAERWGAPWTMTVAPRRRWTRRELPPLRTSG